MTALFIGLSTASSRDLAGALGLSLHLVPVVAGGQPFEWPWVDALEEWERELRSGPQVERVVVCTWDAPQAPCALTALGNEAWQARVELPMARWFAALRGGIARCADGGAVVVVAERPAPLDSSDRADLEALADGLLALVRSAAFIVGSRGVRVNLVTSALASVPEVLHGLAPPLASFPGTVRREIAGAVRLLLSDDAVGITGTAVRADCGRSW
jgi:NAD(P)-dependent dehydrogenase (short-subunit alcohol dehydrogenase family)